MTEHFRARLQQRQEVLKSALCVGLDPDPEQMPEQFKKDGSSAYLHALAWMRDVADKTACFATMFKLQRAYYEAIQDGERTLRELIFYLKQEYPGIPIVIDGKRGDIDRTQRRYRSALFDLDHADGVTVSCYMGSTPFLEMFDARYPHRAIVNLIYNTNPAAREFQDSLMADGDPVWLFMAKRTLRWVEECGALNAGFVMAPAYEKDGAVCSDHLRMCRELDEGKVWYLVPGIGTQNGHVEDTLSAGWRGYGSLALSASSSISTAENPEVEAEQLHLRIKEMVRRWNGLNQ